MSIVARGFALGNTPGAITAEGLGALNLGIVTVINAGKPADVYVTSPNNVINISSRIQAVAAKQEIRVVSARQVEIIIPVANNNRNITIPADETPETS